MSRGTVSFGTVGCRLNQYETDQIKRAFVEKGYRIVPFDAPADVCVINTCTVTGRSDYRSRQLARRARRRNAGATVVVTGCYAQNQPEACGSIPAVDVVVGNARKLDLPDLLTRRNGCPRIVMDPLPRVFAEGPEVRGHPGGRTRAFLKIQDGCDQVCAYCAVRVARGRARSRPWVFIEREAQRAIETGYREIVLTGINLGSYGRDLPGGVSLAAVIERLASMPDIGRIRLSSVEPQEITDELVDIVTSHPKVCRHFHIPFQSGSDGVLRRMNRTYDAGQFEALVSRIAKLAPGCGLGADVMVGFPAESEADFRKTEELIRRLPMTYLHVFSYSPRVGTAAANFGGAVPGESKKARSLALRSLGQEKSLAFRTRSVGSSLRVLFETADQTGQLSGLSGNYIRVAVPGPEHLLNSFADVEVTDVTATAVKGKLVASEKKEAMAS